MPVRRKVFRIEEMVQTDVPDFTPAETAELAMCHHETLRELKALRAMVECHSVPAGPEPNMTVVQELKSELQQLYETVKHTMQEFSALYAAGFEGGQIIGVTNELGAVVGSAENATQRILTAAEIIDEHAGTLSASLRSEHQLSLAQDIQDGVVRIFEACVFHDLTGRRIAKVTAALKVVEDHVARMINIWGGPDAFAEFIPAASKMRAVCPLINGPLLDHETDHVDQSEIDAIFATLRRT